MRIATWNINSVRRRADLVIDFLQREKIDVLALQEIKCKTADFPYEKFRSAGYHAVAHGFNQWNGVAFVSRSEITEIVTSFPGQPGFGAPIKGMEDVQLQGANGLPQEARALGVTVNDVRLWSLYVPNGRSLDHEHYTYKLEWLRQLRASVIQWITANPETPIALMGDWNIAPLRADMGDPSFIEGRDTHVSPPEREMFTSFTEFLFDVVRPYQPRGYTFWNYQGGKFENDQGMRIDFILGSEAFNNGVVAAHISKDERAKRPAGHPLGEIGPSDHVPVVCEIDPELLSVTANFDDSFIW